MPTSRSRIALLIMGGVFLLWAYWNLNDPDGTVWLAVYGTAALCSLLAAFGRLPRAVGLALAAAAFIGAAVQGVRVVAGGEFIFDENGREMLGLLIIGAWLLLALRWSRRQGRTATESSTP